MRTEVGLRRTSYVVILLAVAVALFVALSKDRNLLSTEGVAAAVGDLLASDNLSRLAQLLWDEPCCFWPVTCALSLSWLTCLVCRRRMHRKFSEFWYRLLPELRRSLEIDPPPNVDSPDKFP